MQQTLIGTSVFAQPLADGFAPFGCGKFKQEHYLDHFLNPAHSSYYFHLTFQ